MPWNRLGASSRTTSSSGNLSLSMPTFWGRLYQVSQGPIRWEKTLGKFFSSGGSLSGISRMEHSPDGVHWLTSGTFGVGTFTSNGHLYNPSAGLFIVATTLGIIFTSPDSLTWTQRTSGTTESIRPMCYSVSLGLYLIIGNNGTILTSPDAITWTARTSGVTTNLIGADYIDAIGLFVVAGNSGTILTSPDGVTWTARTSGTVNNLACVHYVPSTGVIYAAGDDICSSTDGITWTVIATGINVNKDMRWSSRAGLFVAACNTDIKSSPDAITWTTRSATGAASVDENDHWFVAGSSVAPKFSEDGITWRRSILNGDLLVAYIAYRGNAAFSAPAGWTKAVEQNTGNTISSPMEDAIGSAVLFYHVWDGTLDPDAAKVFTRTGGDIAVGNIVAFRCLSGTPVLDVTSGNTLTTASQTATTPGLTTAMDDELLVVLGCSPTTGINMGLPLAATDPTAAGAINPYQLEQPSNKWDATVRYMTTTGADVNIEAAYAVKQTQGSTGTISAPCTYSSKHAMVAAAFKYTPNKRGLVSIAGKTRQCPFSSEGKHPALTLDTGRLKAGAAGTKLILDAGRIKQAAAGDTVIT